MNKEPLVLHKKRSSPNQYFLSQNSILVNIKWAKSNVTHIKERIRRNPKRASKGFAAPQPSISSALQISLGRLQSMQRRQPHSKKSPPKEKKRVRKEKNDVVPLLVIILAGSMNACSFRAVSTFRCVASADRACAVILEPLVNAAGMEFVPTRKHTQDLSGLKVAHAYHT